MSIESALGIHNPKHPDLNLREEVASPSSLLYKRLASSPFYRQDMGWLESIWSRHGELTVRTHNVWTNSQLLAVIAESLTNKTGAVNSYYDVLDRFYDERRQLWIPGYHEEAGWIGPHTFRSYDQHLGIIAKSIFNTDSAQNDNQRLKESPLYNSQEDKWYESMSSAGEVSEPSTLSYSSSILVDAVLGDVELTAKKYEATKTGYNIDTYGVYIDPYVDHGVKTATAQRELSAVLLAVMFDKQAAKTKFEALKKTPLYQADTGLWVRWASEEWVPDVCDSSDQFMAVLLEAAFQSTQ